MNISGAKFEEYCFFFPEILFRNIQYFAIEVANLMTLLLN